MNPKIVIEMPKTDPNSDMEKILFKFLELSKKNGVKFDYGKNGITLRPFKKMVTDDKDFTKTVEERKKKFRSECLMSAQVNGFTVEMCKEFFEFWSETTPNGKKMKYELQKTWSFKGRMSRWAGNNQKWYAERNSKKSTNGSTEESNWKFEF